LEDKKKSLGSRGFLVFDLIFQPGPWKFKTIVFDSKALLSFRCGHLIVIGVIEGNRII
jgi:hypothetical protein